MSAENRILPSASCALLVQVLAICAVLLVAAWRGQEHLKLNLEALTTLHQHRLHNPAHTSTVLTPTKVADDQTNLKISNVTQIGTATKGQPISAEAKQLQKPGSLYANNSTDLELIHYAHYVGTVTTLEEEAEGYPPIHLQPLADPAHFRETETTETLPAATHKIYETLPAEYKGEPAQQRETVLTQLPTAFELRHDRRTDITLNYAFGGPGFLDRIVRMYDVTAPVDGKRPKNMSFVGVCIYFIACVRGEHICVCRRKKIIMLWVTCFMLCVGAQMCVRISA